MERKELLNLIKGLELTKKEKRVAEFFLDEEKRIYLMTVSEIANEIGVSDTSVIRFIKSIGFKNFTEFKNSGQQKIKSHLDKTKDFIKNIDIIKENSIEKVYIDKINEEVNRIFSKISLDVLQQIGKMLIRKERKYVVGFKSTAGISNFFGVRLGFMLKDVYSFNIDDSVVINALYNISEKDVFLIFDYPMYSRTAEVLTKIATEKKASIILFTDSDASPLAEYADIIYKAKMNGISIFNSLISSQIFIEYLLTYISQFIEENEKNRFSNIRKYLIEKL